MSTHWLCEMCEQGLWMYYGCDCGHPHRLCRECIERHHLITAVSPDPKSLHLVICPDAMRVALAVMGDPEMLTIEPIPFNQMADPLDNVIATLIPARGLR